MKILTPGHKYELQNFEAKESPGQIIQFIEKEPIAGKPELKTVFDGTTNEEILAVLIDRLQFLKKKVPSRETSVAITKCQEALMWLESRTRSRQSRGVEGTNTL